MTIACSRCRISRRKLLARLRREIQTLQQLDGCEDSLSVYTSAASCHDSSSQLGMHVPSITMPLSIVRRLVLGISTRAVTTQCGAACAAGPLIVVPETHRRCESAIGFEGAFESDTHVYLVMEVVDGGDLSDVLQVTAVAPSGRCGVQGLLACQHGVRACWYRALLGPWPARSPQACLLRPVQLYRTIR